MRSPGYTGDEGFGKGERVGDENWWNYDILFFFFISKTIKSFLWKAPKQEKLQFLKR